MTADRLPEFQCVCIACGQPFNALAGHPIRACADFFNDKNEMRKAA